MTEVFLALGSNVDDSKQYIADAIKLLGKVLTYIKQTPIYCSKAVGVADQPDFLNTAISGQTELEPVALLAEIKAIEHKLGRVERQRWGPREIDIDIIFYGDTVLKSEKLSIPHPAFRNRDFVLRPLNDLNPGLTDPVSARTVAQLLDGISINERSVIGQVDEKA